MIILLLLAYYKMHFETSAEGYKAAAGCRKVPANLRCKSLEVAGRTSNGGCLVSCLIVPVVQNKQV